MSIDIEWRQVDPKDWTSLYTFTPSGDAEALRRAFGDFEFTLSGGDIGILRGMSAAKGINESEKRGRNIFDDLIDAIEKYGTIELRTQS
jgi:hypothetical protein